MSEPAAPVTRHDREAAEWFARLGRPQVERGDLKAFFHWRRDADNAAAYAKVEAAWKATAPLAADPDIQAATAKAQAQTQAAPPKPTVTWSPIPPRTLGFTLAVLAGGLAGGWLWLSEIRAPSFSTKVGEQRTVTLADGSRVRLNTDSRIEVHFKRGERDITLARGEAFFEAAHDPGRPFVVDAGDARVRALGTRFDVRRDPGRVWVALVQGRVQVATPRQPDAAILTPDQQLTVTAQGVSAPAPADAVQATSWTTGRVTFHDLPLSAAVAEMNRYATRKIALDAPLGEARVSGVFDVGDTPAFVAAVAAEFDLKAAPGSGGDIRLVRAAP